MLEKLMKRREEEGFTLIELMVVVLIIAILLAIAIPTFLSARSRAQNRAAQSNLRNALTAAKSIFTDNQSYTGVVAASLQSSEPSLTFVDSGGAGSPDAKTIEVAQSATTITLTNQSASGKCYTIQEDTTTGGTGGVHYGSASPAGGVCHVPGAAPTATTPSGGGW